MPRMNDEQVEKEFKKLVNMTPKTIEKFLDTEESKSVGWVNAGQTESVGHKSGKKIIHILTSKSEPTEDEIAHMRKVISYIKRHMAQKPQKEEIETSRWRYSLMNWGHDPLKHKAS